MPPITDGLPAGDRIMSQWGETLDPSSVLPEYPPPYNGKGIMAEP